MEDLFSIIIVIIGIVGSIASSAKKAKARKAAGDTNWNTVTQAEQAAPKPAAKTEPHPYAPLAVQPMTPAMTFADASGPVIAPMVHTHLQSDCETHDTAGSLNFASTEGKDPCHEDQLTLERTFDEPAPTEGGLTFDWSGENMVKAFVMQEVLTRPAQRHAR